MSETKQTLSRELLERQIAETQKGIQYAQTNIAILTEQLHQQRGILSFAQHLLDAFALPKEEAPKPPTLEVK